MLPGGIIIIFIGFIALAIVARLIAGSFDASRVESYIRERGWKLIDRSWAPFGPGWFGEKNDRIYEIVYEDEDGNTHMAHVKTSLLSGVYLTNDRIVKESANKRALESENEILKKRIAELENREHGTHRTDS